MDAITTQIADVIVQLDVKNMLIHFAVDYGDIVHCHFLWGVVIAWPGPVSKPLPVFDLFELCICLYHGGSCWWQAWGGVINVPNLAVGKM